LSLIPICFYVDNVILEFDPDLFLCWFDPSYPLIRSFWIFFPYPFYRSVGRLSSSVEFSGHFLLPIRQNLAFVL